MLDGVLYHESDLDLEEHYTDTHGYTEINFAAFGMVGMRFCPRIRSLHRQRIYCADPARDHSTNPADFEAYLARWPSGIYAPLATSRLSALRGGPADAPANRPPSDRPQRREAGEVLRDCPTCPELVVIPAGRFRMGCVSGRACEDDERPVHEVEVSSFALGVYEVTFEEYDRFARATGRARPNDRGWGRGGRPVINVSWEDATAFAAWLSEETGAAYRLPSESTWEYAARAGTTTRYSWGGDIGRNRANCESCRGCQRSSETE